MSARRNFTDWFERTYVINLPQRRDRRQQILHQFSRAGVSLEPGRVEIFPAFKPESPAGFPSIGARGCFLSHREVLLTALREGVKRVLVLEDDLELTHHILDRPAVMLSTLDNTPWGLAYLGHNLDLAETHPPQFVVTQQSSVGAHFYALQGEAIAQCVDFLDAVLTREPGDPLGGPMHYDGALTMFRSAHPSLQTVACTVPLGHQGSSRSDITPRPWDRYPVLREVSHTLRRLRRLTMQ